MERKEEHILSNSQLPGVTILIFSAGGVRRPQLPSILASSAFQRHFNLSTKQIYREENLCSSDVMSCDIVFLEFNPSLSWSFSLAQSFRDTVFNINEKIKIVFVCCQTPRTRLHDVVYWDIMCSEFLIELLIIFPNDPEELIFSKVKAICPINQICVKRSQRNSRRFFQTLRRLLSK